MEILTAYIRNSSNYTTRAKEYLLTNMPISMDIQANESTKREVKIFSKVSLDTQAVLTVLGRRKNSFNNGEPNHLNLKMTCLQEADLKEAHLEMAHLPGVYLKDARLEKVHLEGAIIIWANLEGAYLIGAHLEGAHLEGAYLEGAHLEEAYLEGAHLEGAENLTIDQLSKVKTLYNAKLDEKLLKSLEEEYPVEYKTLTKNPNSYE